VPFKITKKKEQEKPVIVLLNASWRAWPAVSQEKQVKD
jgi:hypothetical protein